MCSSSVDMPSTFFGMGRFSLLMITVSGMTAFTGCLGRPAADHLASSRRQHRLLIRDPDFVRAIVELDR